MVTQEFQGRGIALAATAQAIEFAKRDDNHHFMHAFPNVDNVPLNAFCRKLGFELLEAPVSTVSLRPRLLAFVSLRKSAAIPWRGPPGRSTWLRRQTTSVGRPRWRSEVF
jgi:RimJ/RimL family protein N-acetyltransferase